MIFTHFLPPTPPVATLPPPVHLHTNTPQHPPVPPKYCAQFGRETATFEVCSPFLQQIRALSPLQWPSRCFPLVQQPLQHIDCRYIFKFQLWILISSGGRAYSTYESFSDVGESWVWWRADFQSGSSAKKRCSEPFLIYIYGIQCDFMPKSCWKHSNFENR